MPGTDARGLHGWLILDKPRGLGSTQAVAAVKRNLRAAGYGKVKVGHGGTLDPLAEGVLPIALGEATKLAGRMLDASKVYEFAIEIGVETDTMDAEGKITDEAFFVPTEAACIEAARLFVGNTMQAPPAYSAVKVDGKRAYVKARQGEEINLQPRPITIYSLNLELEGYPDKSYLIEADEIGPLLWVEAHVSKGTYVRSLARDLMHALNTRGHVVFLRRLKSGPFDETQAISLDMLNEIGKGAPLQDHLLPLEAGLDDIPALALDPTSAQAVRQGRELSGLPQADGLHFAKLGDVPVALMELAGGTARVVRGFNLPLDVAE